MNSALPIRSAGLLALGCLALLQASSTHARANLDDPWLINEPIGEADARAGDTPGARQPAEQPPQRQRRPQGREVWEDDPRAPEYEPWLSPPREEDMISVTVDGEELLLTPEEYREIQLRRQRLKRELYEDYEMQQLRDRMHESERDTRLRSEMDQRFPLTPEEITRIRERELGVTEAQNRPVVDVESGIRTVNVDIDAPEPMGLHVSRGFISSIVFYDQSGNPWPIKGDVIGDQSAFGSSTIGEHNHVAVFEIKRSFAQSNALIYLDGLDVPLSVRLVGDEGKVDARLSARIPRFGPSSGGGVGGTQGARMAEEIESAPQEMVDLLSTGQIEGAREYQLEGVAGRAFYHQGKLYLRTKADLAVPPIQPPMSQQITSPTGYTVYKIPPVRQLMFTREGELVDARVNKQPEVDIQPAQSIFGD